MGNIWMYIEKVSAKDVETIEKYFNIELPIDYKNLLPSCNRGKPDKAQFDAKSRKGCVLDYMIDLSDVIKTAQRIKKKNFIPIANDPFGNLIGYLINESGNVKGIYFWDHETNADTFVTSSFSDFLQKLY